MDDRRCLVLCAIYPALEERSRLKTQHAVPRGTHAVAAPSTRKDSLLPAHKRFGASLTRQSNPTKRILLLIRTYVPRLSKHRRTVIPALAIQSFRVEYYPPLSLQWYVQYTESVCYKYFSVWLIDLQITLGTSNCDSRNLLVMEQMQHWWLLWRNLFTVYNTIP